MKKILFSILITLLQSQNCFAYIFYSEPATQDVQKSKKELLLTEVNFKNTSADYIILTALQNTNLKNYSLWTDSKIIEFKHNFQMGKNQQLRITFKNTNEEVKDMEIKVTSPGLTSTIEQLSLLNKANSIIDALCWRNKNPGKSEIKDEETLVKISQWQGPCLNSEEIAKNRSVIRINNIDTNTKNDWQIQKEAETSPIINEKQIPATAPPTTNSEKNETPEPVFKKQLSYSNNIEISEVLPNPEGKDAGQEWIELYNNSNEDIDLTNWQLDDEEGGSKAYTFKNKVIKAYSYLVIYDSESKLKLNNSEESVRLIDPNGVVKQEAYFEKSIEGSSYLPKLQTWTLAKTPGTSNIEVGIEETGEETDFIENGDLSTEIHISEIFPNPKGPDNEEWIELYNPSDKTIKLGNWKISNSTKEAVLNNDYSMNPHSFIILDKEDFNFSLKNSKEKISLFDFEGRKIDEITYDKSIEDKSFSRLEDDKWLWLTPSPLEENNIDSEDKINIENSITPLETLSVAKSNNKKTELLKLGILLLLLTLTIYIVKKYIPLIKIKQIKTGLRKKYKKALEKPSNPLTPSYIPDYKSKEKSRPTS